MTQSPHADDRRLPGPARVFIVVVLTLAAWGLLITGYLVADALIRLMWGSLS